MNGGVEIDGKMINCCSTGFMAELTAPVKPGTVLVIRAAGSPWGQTSEEEVRSLSLAEVRWSMPRSAEGEICYATGLKYLAAY